MLESSRSPGRDTPKIAWVWDLERRRIVWASDGALAFWGEDTLLALVARGFGPDDVTVLSLDKAWQALTSAHKKPFASKTQEALTVRLKLVPDAHVLLARCLVKLFALPDERHGLHVQVLEIEDSPKDPELNPDIVLARSAPVPLALYDIEGALIQENAASQVFHPSDHFSTLSYRLVGGQTASILINRCLSDGLYSKILRINSRYGIRRAQVTAQRSAHPVSGAPTLTVSVIDMEDTVQMWADVAARLEAAQVENADPAEAAPSKPEPAGGSVIPMVPPVPDSAEGAAAAPDFYHKMLDALPWGVLSFDGSGHIDFANAHARVLLLGSSGTERDALNGLRFVSLLSPITQKRVEKSLAAAGQKPKGSPLVFDMDSRFAVAGRGVNLRMTLLGLIENKAPHYYAILTDRDSGTGPAPQSQDVIASKIDDQLRYVASLSHDMRTPLNAIIGFSEIMKDERLGPIHNDRYKDYAADIYTSSGHLLTLVNDLLDFSKFKSGQLQVRATPTNLGETVTGAARLLDLECQRMGVSIKVDVARNLPEVNVDPILIERALLNVLSNAVKFSPHGEVVSLSARVLSTGTVCITVQDRGPGMSASDIELAMEPFRQTASAEKLSSERPHIRGTGLGLPLAKALVEANHGSFILKSQVGAGTTAAITFPASQVVSHS